ncbi:MAG: electron transport complex subunit RsxC [Candidatus Aminicenantia bacterium]
MNWLTIKRSFSGGVHLNDFKKQTESQAIKVLNPAGRVVIPLYQHFGAPAEPIVKKGEEVKLGQKIGEAKARFSAPVHSSVSGKVLAVDYYNHPNGQLALSIIIENDGQDIPYQEMESVNDPFSLTSEEIRQRVKEAGVVGLGGAAFPTSIKITPPENRPIDTIVINGCECEPFLNADNRLMIEYPEDILKGGELVRIATGAKKIIVGIEDNKPDAIQIMEAHARDFPLAEVVPLKTKYPQGAEKNLIQAILKRKVPAGGLPFDVGVVVQNVATAKAIWDAVSKGKPLYERVVTVTGPGIIQPKNVLVRVGTLFQEVIDFCGGLKEEIKIVIMGGPMMGLAQWSLDVPVIKATSGIIALTSLPSIQEMTCIRCGRCVEHCPMGLVPTQLMKYTKFEKFSAAEKWGILNCVECGCCEYVCPANIPLVHWIRTGKAKVSLLRS